MKHILFLFIVCIFFACNNTKENTGLQVGKTIVTADGEPVSKNEFNYGQTVNIGFKNVTGLTKFEGKVYPEGSIYLLNEKKDTVEITSYNFKEEFVSDKPLNLDINLMAVLTDATNKNFELRIKLEDKKGTGLYNYSMPFKIKPNENFSLKAKGISYSNIYLFHPKKGTVITDNVINSNEEFTVIYEGLNGFKADNIGFIYPSATAKIVDANGAILLEEENLLKDYKDLGFKYEKAFSSLPLSIKINNANKAFSPLNLTVELYDLKSDNKLELETTLDVK